MLLVRRLRYGLVAFAVFVIVWLLWQSRAALAPFFVGAVLAFILAPLVERFAKVLPFHRRKPDLARSIAIFEVYLIGLAVMGGAGLLIVPALIDEAQNFIDNAPEYAERAQAQMREWNTIYRERVPPEAQARIEEYAGEIGGQLGGFARGILTRTFGFTQSAFSLVIGYLVIPFWLFYILKDRHKIGPMIQHWFPPGLRGDVDACINIVRRVLGSYIRAQLTLGLFIGVFTTIGLWTMDRFGWVDMQYAVVLGIIAGITELVPVIGPIIGAIPAIIITLATDPDRAWIVILFYVAVQQIENAVLVPRIQGQAVEMHPAIIIVLLVVAQQVAGFLGMIVAVPLAAVSRDLYKYVYRRLQEREQEIAHPRVLRLERAQPVPPAPPASADPPPTERASSE
jgi:predicted PurR-regulated permease PerM